MKSVSSYIYGFQAAAKSLRMILLVYLAYLGISLLLAIPFYNLFLRASGNSELPGLLLKDFDATAIRELLASGGKYFGFYVQAFLPWILAFFLFQVYLGGAFLSWISNPRGNFSMAVFHLHGRKFFWRFIKLAVCFLIIHLLIILVLYLPYILITGSKTGLTDEQTLRPLIFIVGAHLILLVFVFLLSDLVKSRIFNQDSRKILRSLFSGIKLAFKRFFSFYFLGFLLLIVSSALFAGFYLLRRSADVSTVSMVLVIFIVQQIFIFCRVFIRVWRLGSAYSLYLRLSE